MATGRTRTKKITSPEPVELIMRQFRVNSIEAKSYIDPDEAPFGSYVFEPKIGNMVVLDAIDCDDCLMGFSYEIQLTGYKAKEEELNNNDLIEKIHVNENKSFFIKIETDSIFQSVDNKKITPDSLTPPVITYGYKLTHAFTINKIREILNSLDYTKVIPPYELEKREVELLLIKKVKNEIEKNINEKTNKTK